jgi:hypothetical protein
LNINHNRLDNDNSRNNNNNNSNTTPLTTGDETLLLEMQKRLEPQIFFTFFFQVAYYLQLDHVYGAENMTTTRPLPPPQIPRTMNENHDDARGSTTTAATTLAIAPRPLGHTSNNDNGSNDSGKKHKLLLFYLSPSLVQLISNINHTSLALNVSWHEYNYIQKKPLGRTPNKHKKLTSGLLLSFFDILLSFDPIS